jgi:hypothetical protein
MPSKSSDKSSKSKKNAKEDVPKKSKAKKVKDEEPESNESSSPVTVADLLTEYAEKETEIKLRVKERAVIFTKLSKAAMKSEKKKKRGENAKPANERKLPINPKFYDFVKTALKDDKFSDETTDLVNAEVTGKKCEITRRLIQKVVHAYISFNGFGGERDAQYKTDKALKTLFSLTKDDDFRFQTIPTMITRIFPKVTDAEKAASKKSATKTATKTAKKKASKPETEDEESEDEASDDEDGDASEDDDGSDDESSEEESVAPAPKKKSKSKK